MKDQGRDPGLQPERTRLAWRRTTLSFTVAVILAAKAVVDHGGWATVPACAVGALLWVAFLTVAHRRMRGLAASTRPAVLPGALGVAAVCCSLALVVCAVAIVV
ncbi:DUF202 domain-containing protein [Streptomyces sp. NPDC050560]|uniref:DUF202 domain-containing protein n=1 Tax=Streptomyces sp. NPDC050560 TaxID=3365630 RepID=UPI0037BD137D